MAEDDSQHLQMHLFVFEYLHLPAHFKAPPRQNAGNRPENADFSAH